MVCSRKVQAPVTAEVTRGCDHEHRLDSPPTGSTSQPRVDAPPSPGIPLAPRRRSLPRPVPRARTTVTLDLLLTPVPHRTSRRGWTWSVRMARHRWLEAATQSASVPTMTGSRPAFSLLTGHVAQHSPRCHPGVREGGHNQGQVQRDRSSPRIHREGRPTCRIGPVTAPPSRPHQRWGRWPSTSTAVVGRLSRRALRIRCPDRSAGTDTDPTPGSPGTGTGPGGRCCHQHQHRTSTSTGTGTGTSNGGH